MGDTPTPGFVSRSVTVMEKRSGDERPSSALSSEIRPGSEARSDWSLSGGSDSETHHRRERVCEREVESAGASFLPSWWCRSVSSPLPTMVATVIFLVASWQRCLSLSSLCWMYSDASLLGVEIT